MAHRAIVKHRRRDLSSLHDVGLRFRFAPQVVSLEALVIVRRIKQSLARDVPGFVSARVFTIYCWLQGER